MTGEDRRTSALSRRTLLLGGAALLSGCVADSGGPRRPRGPNGLPSASPSPTPPPVPPPYRAPAGDALISFKEVAGRFVQGIATFDLAEGSALAPLTPVGYVGKGPALAAAAAPLRVPDRWSRATVEVVQYGGLTPVSVRATSGVAMVVLRQVLQDRDGAATVVRRTLDVRLRRRGDVWQVEALASAGGTRVERPAKLAASAKQVLDDERIDLPDSARWDIYAGQISPELLQVMLGLADISPLRVTVLKTGHPQRVVDGRTSPPISAHFRGQAVDINSLDGSPVADAPPALVRAVVAAAGARPEVSQVGVPMGFDFDKAGRRGFSNLVHADHLHIAVRRPA